ncbi:MAG: response regulator [Candidatus Pacebacteria bacterium]|nr:response regulator [Candidatus Paceibacterota bacterium]
MNNNKKKILIIEDEATLQKALSDMLIKEGYEVVSAIDGLIGLDLARSENPDLILLDIILPGMDGFDVLRNIKQKDNSEVPVIILTNLSDLDDIQKALDIGATTYLVKADFHLADVLKKVEEVLVK